VFDLRLPTLLVVVLDHRQESPERSSRVADDRCLYRVAQEALNNVAKHAQATAVRIDLELIEGEGTRLAIRDDGRGIQAADRHKPGSFGLRGMAERVRAVGGTWSVEGAPGGGTRVELFVPVSGSSASGHLA